MRESNPMPGGPTAKGGTKPAPTAAGGVGAGAKVAAVLTAGAAGAEAGPAGRQEEARKDRQIGLG